MTGFSRNATDKNLRAWLNAGPVDRGVGDGLTFFAKATSAREGKASWILRYRYGGRQREKVIGRYPDISLKDARDLARKDRALLQQGVDVGAVKRQEKLKAIDMHNVEGLAQIWYERHIVGRYKHPLVVERVIRRHIRPVIGKLPVEEVRPVHIDGVLTKTRPRRGFGWHPPMASGAVLSLHPCAARLQRLPVGIAPAKPSSEAPAS